MLINGIIGNCNIALVNHAVPAPLHILPSLNSWESVRTGGDHLITRCITPGAGGSVIIPPLEVPYSGLVLIIWEAGASYDGLCNEIQNMPMDIQPTLSGLFMNGTVDEAVPGRFNVSQRVKKTVGEAFKLRSNVSTS
ncbi:hypothetical protein N7G274_010219 [Stereocaulon virgatum]|uniref:Uncharacterized protein n=1 Tax=Stereocaulon virgatum TaxID=373712 RepID=A0ABR3ZU51_9LECA